MTLDEAIKHCEEKAKELRTDYEVYKNSKEKYGSEYYREVPVVPAECLECAEEHKQLAEWLKELKALKERPQGELAEKLKDRIGESVCKYCPKMNRHCELCEISRVFSIIELTNEEMKGGAE